MAKLRRVTDRLPLSAIVSPGNLDDRLANVAERIAGHERLDDERWTAHKEVHQAVAASLADYKRDSNEWRASLQDLRLTFIPKAEFQSEHRALDAKMHGEVQTARGEVAALGALVSALDLRIDANTQDIKTSTVEQSARRSVFSDSRNVLATAGIAFGLISTVLLILDRVSK